MADIGVRKSYKGQDYGLGFLLLSCRSEGEGEITLCFNCLFGPKNHK